MRRREEMRWLPGHAGSWRARVRKVAHPLRWPLFMTCTRLFALALFLAIPLSPLACSDSAGDCTSLCEEAEAEGCNTFDLGQGSCASDCQLADRVAETSGCREEADARLACEQDQDDICDSGCGSQDQAFAQCVFAYCQQNLDDSDCQALAEEL